MSDVAARRPSWLLILVLSATGAIGTLQYVVVLPLLPELPRLFDASVSDVSWVITSTLLTGALATPILARLADMYGHRPLAILSMGFIVIGSGIAMVADNIWVLVLGRAIAGLSSAVAPIGIAIMRDALPPHRLGFGIGLMSTSFAIGIGLGLPLGGWLYTAFGWQSVFLFSLIFCSLFIAVMPFAIARSPRQKGARFDLLGAVLLSVALLALLIGISKGAEWGWLSPLTLGFLIVGVVTSAAWIAQERRARQPLVDLRAAFSHPILVTNITSLLFGFAVFGNMIITTAQLQVPESSGGIGLDSLQTGLVLFIPGVVTMVASPAAAVMVQRFGGRVTLLVGASLLAVGYLERTLLTSTVPEILVGSILMQIGMTLGFGGIPAIITRHTPIEQTAAANGFNALIRNIGTSLASAEIAAVFTLTTVSPEGIEHPTPLAFAITFIIAGVVAVATVAIAFVIPRERGADAGSPGDASPPPSPGRP